MAKNRQAQDRRRQGEEAEDDPRRRAAWPSSRLGVLQGPKLLKRAESAAPEAAAVVDGSTAVPPAATPVPGQTPTTVQRPSVPRRSGPAILAGVTLSSDSLPAADDDQLRSFSLFVAKDPFVQQSSEEDAPRRPRPPR